MTKAERIAVFFERLEAATPVSTAAAAFALLVETFLAVEDEFCTDVADRMFPPSGEFHFAVDGREDLDIYRQRAHDTIVAANGAIVIRIRRSGTVQFEKAGANGQKVIL